MSLEHSIKENEPYILVEGPKWGDAEFYGKWLLAAAKADALWKKATNDPSLEEQFGLVTMIYIPDFGIGATVMVSQLEENLASFAIQLNGVAIELVDEFVMMAEMGFFVLTGQRYQMAIPAKLNMDVVKRAALKFAQTEDEDILHPEHLVVTMPYAEAKAWQERLRLLLLENGPQH
jgi:hypothetical protein